ncbi:uncharacterized protein LOC112270046 [Brachypodium distachyon]|uniref:Uncharacterized protein n=1 Tax=Brachypodium distachyon TaxID=15368 RepID=I1GYA9_BRADI|nr:uncharacterized protein LOC112270046 [Brachypodium distachyon]KQK18149.1 hypothetical protein BRADI_1g39130v3 [Brachypodium distachyon]|eukprot:XP_024313472.1 uncharacterized protein LOC112270046 [Brachypodium distachyon]
MASPSSARALPLFVLLVIVVLLLSSLSALAASDPPRATLAAGRMRQDFHDATSVAMNDAGRGPISGRRRRRAPRGAGTGAWAFSGMLPRGFAPPSGSSACHNDMPATAAEARFYACGGSGSP